MIGQRRSTLRVNWSWVAVLPAILSCNKIEIKNNGRFSPEAASVLGVCTQCHANGRAENGFGYVDDVDMMIAKGKIVPGNPQGSRLFQKVSQNWGTGRRMPLRGPYLGPEALESLRKWIADDLYEAKVDQKWTVEVVAGSGVTLDKEGKQIVGDGEQLEINITLDNPNAVISIGGTGDCVKGAAPLAGANTSYSTGRIKADCSLTITRTGTTQEQEFSASLVAAYGDEVGATPNIDTGSAPKTKIVGQGKTATFTFNLRAGDTLNTGDLNKSIGGTCAKGQLTLLNAVSREYSYTTGALNQNCVVKVLSDNPCPTVITDSNLLSFANARNNLNSGGAACTSCHYNGSESPNLQFGSGAQGAAIDLSQLRSNSALNNMKFIEPSQPLASAVYLQIDPTLNFAGRMPKDGPFITLEKRSQICNWILQGAN